MRLTNIITAAVAATVLLTATVGHAANKWGLKPSTVSLKSAGSLTFGPDGILLIGDAKAATIYAISTGDASGSVSEAKLNVENLNSKVAKALGSKSTINDLAVNPESGNVYLSVTAGGTGTILKVDQSGAVSKVNLNKVLSSKAVLSNPPADKVVKRGRRSRNARDDAITDIVYIEGKVIVSGLTNDPKASSVIREFAFPFSDSHGGFAIEIYHGAHGRYETGSAVRAFVPFTIDGEPSLLAGFTCTPLVKFPLGVAKKKSVRGTTVAELGNRNRPLDMIVYKKDGKDFVLMANSARGVMKISTADLDRSTGITERVSGGGTAGQKYETIESLVGVIQLDKLNAENAIILVQNKNGSQDLRTISLP
jgi:hypothetical protein